MTEHHNIEETPMHEPIEQDWQHIDSSRPPIFNSDNCCSAEAGAFANGHLAQPSPYNQTFYEHEPAPLDYRRTESNASSNPSFRGPEGPERDAPCFHIQPSNTWLSVVPEPGYNESEHQLQSAYQNDLPYPMQRFLETPEYFNTQAHLHPYADEEPEPTKMRFLNQEVYIRGNSSMRARQSSRRSKQSRKSGKSLGSGEGSSLSWSINPMTAVGAWDDKDGTVYIDCEYPSGLSDCNEWSD